ncbi:MAG: hypothetical protein WCT36_05285 [Candidatus Gracilibacteria bacterium]|jgi:hypothetical protein
MSSLGKLFVGAGLALAGCESCEDSGTATNLDALNPPEAAYSEISDAQKDTTERFEMLFVPGQESADETLSADLDVDVATPTELEDPLEPANHLDVVDGPVSPLVQALPPRSFLLSEEDTIAAMLLAPAIDPLDPGWSALSEFDERGLSTEIGEVNMGFSGRYNLDRLMGARYDLATGVPGLQDPSFFMPRVVVIPLRHTQASPAENDGRLIIRGSGYGEVVIFRGTGRIDWKATKLIQGLEEQVNADAMRQLGWYW